jgi:hypothetical protein
LESAHPMAYRLSGLRKVLVFEDHYDQSEYENTL